jgi:hypothetical protein
MRWLPVTLLLIAHAPALAMLATAGAYVPTATGALATRPLSIRELTAAADTIVVGRVAAVRSEAAAAGPITRIDVDVEQPLKGQPAASLTIVQPGGEAAGVASRVAGVPTFVAGERVLMFLTRRPDGALRVAHLYQGKFSIEADPPQAVRRLPDSQAVLDAMPLDDALAVVRAALPATRGQGRRE